MSQMSQILATQARRSETAASAASSRVTAAVRRAKNRKRTVKFMMPSEAQFTELENLTEAQLRSFLDEESLSEFSVGGSSVSPEAAALPYSYVPPTAGFPGAEYRPKLPAAGGETDPISDGHGLSFLHSDVTGTTDGGALSHALQSDAPSGVSFGGFTSDKLSGGESGFLGAALHSDSVTDAPADPVGTALPADRQSFDMSPTLYLSATENPSPAPSPPC
jgi:hypothetical protein